MLEINYMEEQASWIIKFYSNEGESLVTRKGLGKL
jgi:hypothetical protein